MCRSSMTCAMPREHRSTRASTRYRATREGRLDDVRHRTRGDRPPAIDDDHVPAVPQRVSDVVDRDQDGHVPFAAKPRHQGRHRGMIQPTTEGSIATPRIGTSAAPKPAAAERPSVKGLACGLVGIVWICAPVAKRAAPP